MQTHRIEVQTGLMDSDFVALGFQAGGMVRDCANSILNSATYCGDVNSEEP